MRSFGSVSFPRRRRRPPVVLFVLALAACVLQRSLLSPVWFVADNDATAASSTRFSAPFKNLPVVGCSPEPSSSRIRSKDASQILPSTNTTTSTTTHDAVTIDQLRVLFDCDDDLNTLCTYFSPYDFFHDTYNASSDDYRRLGGTNRNLPALTALSWWRDSGDDSGNVYSVPSTIPTGGDDTNPPLYHLPHNISFVHVHKCGGSTVKALFHRLAYYIQQTQNDLPWQSEPTVWNAPNSTQLQYHAHVQTYKHSFGGGTRARKERNDQERLQHIQALAEMQENDASVLFTVLRDPVQRFLSAVQQVMHYRDDFRETCLKATAKATIACAIAETRRTEYLRDVHLVPMATHFRLLNEYPTLRVAVFSLDDINLLSQYFVTSSTSRAKLQNHSTSEASLSVPESDTTHLRDRSQVEIATSTVLAEMSVDDCDASMLREICDLYAIDVALLQSLGQRTLCCSIVDE